MDCAGLTGAVLKPATLFACRKLVILVKEYKCTRVAVPLHLDQLADDIVVAAKAVEVPHLLLGG